jgi:hypothetical protein
MGSTPPIRSTEDARVVVDKTTSKLKEARMLTEALTTQAFSGPFQAFQRNIFPDKLEMEMDIGRGRMEDLGQRQEDLERLRKCLCTYARVNYWEV